MMDQEAKVGESNHPVTVGIPSHVNVISRLACVMAEMVVCLVYFQVLSNNELGDLQLYFLPTMPHYITPQLGYLE